MTDVPGTIESTVALEVNRDFTGVMETAGDVDFYRVTLEAGTIYSIVMSRMEEPIRQFRLALYDASGEVLLHQDWRDGLIHPYVVSAFGMRVAETGTYFVAAINTDSVGDWQHHLSLNAPEEFFGTVNVLGTNADDFLFGTSSDEVIYGRGGGDAISGRAGADTVFGGSGNDVINGVTGRDRLSGGDGNDTLSGGDSDDRLTGSTGRDVLKGDKGNDRLDGGAGGDTMTGGTGRDVFIFTASSQTGGRWTDRITDFTRGTDIIDLGSFDDLAFSGRTAKANSVWFERSGSSVKVSIDSTGDAVADQFITLSGVTRLTASDFDLI